MGHKGAVTSLVLCPVGGGFSDHLGQILISGSADCTIKVWEINTGKILYVLKGHEDEVTSLSLSQDGKTLISGSKDKTIKIWNWHGGELLQTLVGHEDVVTSVAISANGNKILSGSADTTLKIWQFKHR